MQMQVEKAVSLCNWSSVERALVDYASVPQPLAQLHAQLETLDLGVIDSTGVLELVLVIEENFAMQVKDSAMVPENFDSVDRIVSFVMRSKAA